MESRPLKYLLFILIVIVLGTYKVQSQSQPRSVSLVEASDQYITIRWNFVAGKELYDILRASSPAGPYQVIENGHPSRDSKESIFTDYDVSRGNEYCYKVRVHNTNGESTDNECVTISSHHETQLYTISGQVRGSSGIEGVEIKMEDLVGNLIGLRTYTNASGHYELQGIPRGKTGYIKASKLGYTLSDNLYVSDIQENLTGYDFTLEGDADDHYVTITSPNSSFTQWETGTDQAIRFATDLTGEIFDVYLHYSSGQQERHVRRAGVNGIDWHIPHTIASGSYYLKVKGRGSGIETTSHTFNIYNASETENRAPRLIQGVAESSRFLPQDSITFTAQWIDEEDDYLVNARIRYETATGLAYAGMDFIPGSSPASFQKKVLISEPGDYDYEFAINDDEDLNGSPYLHPEIWQGKGTLTVIDSAGLQERCSFPDLESDSPYKVAVSFLCEAGIVQGEETTGNIAIDRDIWRGELAKIAYFSIQLNGIKIADEFPAIYSDLQKSDNLFYSIPAKNLLYLEYQNGISPFDRDKLSFNGEAPITIAHTLKVLLETWNVNLQTGANPFDQDYSTHDSYEHLYTAFQLGLIDETVSANQACTRGEAFEYLFQLMNHAAVIRPTVSLGDFYIPPNITQENIGNLNTLANNYLSYQKASFYIPGIGLPLGFGHQYQPFVEDLPGELFPMRPLGYNWTHTYNSYLIDLAGNIHWDEYFDRVVIALPGGRMSIFRLSTKGRGYESMEPGDQSELERTSPTQFVYTTQSGTHYTFVKIRGTGVNFPFVLSTIQDRNGNTITLNYENGVDGVHYQRLRQVVGTTGKRLLFSYHPGTDRVKEVVDPDNRHIAFEYGETAGGLTELMGFTDAELKESQYFYVPDVGYSDLLTKVQLPKGNFIGADYENRKLKAIATGRDKVNIERAPYNPGQTNYIEVKLDYESGGDLTAYFDERNNLRSLQGLESYTASFNHPNFPDIPSSITYEGLNYSTDVDPIGNVNGFTVGSRTNSLEYGVYGLVTSYTDAEGNAYESTYDDRGNRMTFSTPLGTTQNTHATNGLVTSITNPEGITVQLSYDLHGNLIGMQAPEGISQSATYDNLGRVRSIIRPDGQSESFRYDKNDNTLQSLTGLDVSMGYDANDNLQQITNLKGQETRLGWEFEGDLLESLAFGGRTEMLNYNEAGELERFTKPDGTVFNFTYEADGKLKTATGGGKTLSITYAGENPNRISYNGTNHTLGYDSEHRVNSSIQVHGQVKYSYNKLGQVTTMTYPNSQRITYTYAQGVLQKVEDWRNNSATFSYRQDGLISGVQYSNGTYGIYQYDGAGRLSHLSWHKSDSTVICSYDLELNPMGFPLRESRTEPYHLDSLDLSNYSHSFSYGTGNNELVNGAGKVYEHDANGNITLKGSDAFSWDEQDRLVGTTDYQYWYEGTGLRHQRRKKANGQYEFYVYDVSSSLPNLIYESRSRDCYVYGLGLNWQLKGGGNVFFYHFDPRGNAVAITDGNGEISHKYAYSPYGKILAEEEEHIQPFKFSGQYGIMHEGGGLYYMRARYYDAEVGRFLSTDPILDANNLYAYGANNPTMYVDPSGKNWISIDRVYYRSKMKEANEYLRDFGGGIADFIFSYQQMTKAYDQLEDEEDILKDGLDKYFHAKANFMATRRGAGGERAAIILSNIREDFWGKYIKRNEIEDMLLDQVANKFGREQSKNGLNLQEALKSYRIPILPSGY